MDIGEVLSRAWQIVWKHKVLWIFGILASCNGANGSSTNYRVSQENGLPPQITEFFNNNFPDWQLTLIIIGVIAVLLILIVLAIFLGTLGRIGLIRGVQKADEGAPNLAFGDLFGGSIPYFWRVFGLNLLVGLAIFTLVVVGVVLGLLTTVATLGIGAICLIPLICLAVPFFWVVNIVVTLSYNSIVLENLGISAGLQRGWQVFRENIGNIIVMALILGLGVGLIGGFIITLPFAIIIGPAIVGWLSGSGKFFGGSLLVTGLCLVGYLPVLIVLNGILESFISSSWTLTFRRLTAPKVYPEPV